MVTMPSGPRPPTKEESLARGTVRRDRSPSTFATLVFGSRKGMFQDVGSLVGSGMQPPSKVFWDRSLS